jgi:hypothetical protein
MHSIRNWFSYRVLFCCQYSTSFEWRKYIVALKRAAFSDNFISLSDKKHSVPLKVYVFQPAILTVKFLLWFLPPSRISVPALLAVSSCYTLQLWRWEQHAPLKHGIWQWEYTSSSCRRPVWTLRTWAEINNMKRDIKEVRRAIRNFLGLCYLLVKT